MNDKLIHERIKSPEMVYKLEILCKHPISDELESTSAGRAVEFSEADLVEYFADLKDRQVFS